MLTKIKNYIGGHKKTSIISVLVLFLVLFFVYKGGGGQSETLTVERGNIVEQVILTGKIKPVDEVKLAFDRSGKVSNTFVQVGSNVVVGQSLVTLDSAEIYAEYLRAEANIVSEQARLDELKRGTRPEEIAILESEVLNAQTALSTAEDRLRTSLYEAYTKSDDAIRNNIDQFFSNPRTANPQINVTINDAQLKNDINLMRFEIEGLLVAWDKNPQDTSRATIVRISNDLNTVKMFVAKVASAVNALSANSSLSNTTVESYKASASSARNSLIAGQNSIGSSEERLNTTRSTLLIAQKNLNLKKVGASAEEVRAQEARVLQSQASLQAVGAQLSKMTLRSPLAGVVTQQDAKKGQIVSISTPVVSVISNNNLEIEANVSEISVGKVQIGNLVDITMDAFAGKTFTGTVTYIEPAETIVDGVVNFKITIAFNENYEQIKTGLSTNLSIKVAEVKDALRIAQYAITKREGKSYVSKKEGKNIVEIEVTTGFRGSDGLVEVLSGLQVGDVVVLQDK